MLNPPSKWLIRCSAPPLFLLTGLVANGSMASAGGPPPREPIVIQREENPKDEKAWSPLLPNKELLPMSPEVHEVLEGIKGGRPESFERAVRLSYRLIEAYARNEGHKIDIRISDVRTINVPEVWDLRFSDLVSLDQAEHVDVESIVRVDTWSDGNKSRKTTKLGYKMKWMSTRPDPDLRLRMKRNVREFVEVTKADEASLPLLRAMTTYRVSLTLDDKHKEYRASFLWMGGATPTPLILKFQCQDKVIDQVSLALAEQVPPEGRQEGGLLGLALREDKSGSKYAFPVCNVYTKYPYTSPWELHDGQRHVTGYFHQSYSEVDASCSCSSDCQSICHPSLAFNLCYDNGGTTGGYHVGAKTQRLEGGTRADALNLQSGAGCMGKVVCAMAQCATADCLFSVSLGPSGPQFTSNPSNAMIFWAFEPTTNVGCGGCTEWERPVVEPDIPAENCPVLIALDEGHLEMTDLAGGVRFDVNRDGTAERNSWPAPGSSWAFVVMDRNFNGRIDNGGELFGNYTKQYLDDRPTNGYAALAAYDRPENGGNGDGLLDNRDAIFPSLLLWMDANQDGASQPHELIPLAERVEEIGLTYRESRSRDRYGNQFRYRGTVRLADGRRSRSVDVFLLHD